MEVLRTTRGVTRKDRIRNTAIRTQLYLPLLLEEKERNRLRWYGHVMKMEEDKKPNRCLMWKPAGKRPVVRLRRRWIEGVKVSLNKREAPTQEVGDL